MELTKEIWTQSDYDEFAEYLKTLADEKYKKFSDSLVPGGTQSIGIRVPILRQTAKAISKGDYASFLNCKNNAYREEIMIKGLVMSLIKCDYHEMLGYIKQYVAQITSWIYRQSSVIRQLGKFRFLLCSNDARLARCNSRRKVQR